MEAQKWKNIKTGQQRKHTHAKTEIHKYTDTETQKNANTKAQSGDTQGQREQ